MRWGKPGDAQIFVNSIDVCTLIQTKQMNKQIIKIQHLKILSCCHIWQGTNEYWKNVYSLAFSRWQFFSERKALKCWRLTNVFVAAVRQVGCSYLSSLSFHLRFYLITDLEICLSAVMVYYTFTCYIKVYVMKVLHWTIKR